MGTRILFRADGNEQVGAGHAMRCLSLACAAKELGCECLFVMADDSFKNVVDSYGIDNVLLDTKYNEMLLELPKLTKVIEGYKPDVIIVDSYFVNSEYFQKLKAYTKIIYIDDLVEKAYEVDGLINYNAYANESKYLKLYVHEGLKLPFNLFGVKYTPLRKEFQEIEIDTQNTEVKDILFSAGGADPERIAINFVKELLQDEERLSCYNFHLILGSFEPDKDEIKEIASSRPWLCIHENVTKMSELMLECQIAVSAAGSTLYELCACGVPTITYVLADNQIHGAEALSYDGTMIHAGDFRIEIHFYENLISEVKRLISDDNLRLKMAQKAKNKIDGNGAKRTIEELIAQFSR